MMVFSQWGCAQPQTGVQNNAAVSNPQFDLKIKEYLDFTVPTIDVDSLQKNYSDFIIFDAREKEEYDLSHLPDAIFIGYKNPNLAIEPYLKDNKEVVIYCSIGYRSEKIGEKLQANGYEVYNLYGSIFEWVNKGYPLQDSNAQETQKIHGYSKSWSQWIEHGGYEVVY